MRKSSHVLSVADHVPAGRGSIAAIIAGSALFGIVIPLDKPNDLGAMETEIAALLPEMKQKVARLGEIATDYDKRLKDAGTAEADVKTKFDKAFSELNGITAQVKELEQKMARRGEPSQHDLPASIGRTFVDSNEFKAVADAYGRGNWFGQASVEVKAITSATAVLGQSARTALIEPTQAPMVDMPVRPRTIRSLCQPGRTNSLVIEYMRETVRTLNAAAVAENPSADKPESTLGWDLTNVSVRTIAHFIKASKQILADAPQLQSRIDSALRLGLELEEDRQLLLGSGAANNILGMIPQATAYAAPAGVTVSAESRIDRLRLSMLQTVLALYPATGFVLNPIDWAAIEMVKDTQGRYVIGDPRGQIGANLWGLPIAISFIMPTNSFLTGAFAYACQIFDREDANVLISSEDGNNFVRNMVTILAEERLALVVSRPQALIYGNFTGVVGGPSA